MKKTDRSRMEKKNSRKNYEKNYIEQYNFFLITVHSNETSCSLSFICNAVLTTSLCMLENLTICSLKERKKIEVAHLQL